MTHENNVVEFPDIEVVEMEAAEWVARLDTRELSPAERAELQAWAKRSPVHQEAIERMAAVWGAADILDEYNLIDPLDGEAPSTRPATRRMAITGAIAASLALVFGGVAFQLGVFTPSKQFGTFQTAVGEQETIELADGSTMILNTNTKVKVDITRERRTIHLARGEAHFEVARDPGRPFDVYAGQGLVQAVGTAFSVHLREKDVEVIVSEGVVQVLAREESAVPSGDADKKVDAALAFRPLAALAVNDNAVFADKIERLGKLDDATLERRLMWRDGLIAFSGEPLSEVVSEMSRYTDIRIDIADPALAATPIGGAFEAGDIQSMFDALETVFGIEVEAETPSRVRLVRQS